MRITKKKKTFKNVHTHGVHCKMYMFTRSVLGIVSLEQKTSQNSFTQ